MKQLGMIVISNQTIDLNIETIIRQAESDLLLIFISNADKSLDCMRPFTYQQIHTMIELLSLNIPTYVIPIKYTFPDNTVKQIIVETNKIKTLIGGDITITDYTNKITSNITNDGLTKLLVAFYEYDAQYLKDNLSPMLLEYISNIIYDETNRHILNMHGEYAYIKKYKESWATVPYPPIFVTVDAVVCNNGHILLVKRKAIHGKGQWALSGGFMEQSETIEDSIVRELKEETCIDVGVTILKNSIKKIQVFSEPSRSLRGRTISHVGLIMLNDEYYLPTVMGADDAESAKWLPLCGIDSMVGDLFEDHYIIIKEMLRGN